ncbi:MAG: hypothetical protein EXR65_01320 [Dehalococcoidia bacterium]|nr:hypothetical protein [Dehalococcoidia bacterium]
MAAPAPPRPRARRSPTGCGRAAARAPRAAAPAPPPPASPPPTARGRPPRPRARAAAAAASRPGTSPPAPRAARPPQSETACTAPRRPAAHRGSDRAAPRRTCRRPDSAAAATPPPAPRRAAATRRRLYAVYNRGTNPHTPPRVEHTPVRVRVKLFAGLKDVIGGDLEERFEGPTVTVQQLHERLERAYPLLAPRLAGVAIAVNQEFMLDGGHELHDGDEVALIPPISGGSGDVEPGADAAGTPHFLITERPLDPRALRELVRGNHSGAIVIFEGVVRDRHEGYEVQRIEYHAYESMALKQLQAVAEAVRAELAVHDIAIHHRTGRLEIGEASLVVAVSAEHRAEAFAAALRAVDRVKESVPVWKREFTPDGPRWQEGSPARPVR